MRQILLFLFLLTGINCFGQTTINFNDTTKNKLFIKLYAEIDYNQKIEAGKKHKGILDVHRLVPLFGFQFNKNTQFVTEIEVEHVNEIFVEQAFIKHRIIKNLSFKGGLILVPMGFINEQHEPTFFYSVERPLVDKNIIPTTWREIGIGVTGLMPKQSLRYQLYLVNSPISYKNGEAKVSGESGFRSGRQKAIKSVITTLPAISGQIEYFGLNNTKLGLSAYYGKTNTSLYGDDIAKTTIDSSTLNIAMAALHASNDWGRLNTRIQYVSTLYSNTESYNAFTKSDVPQLMHGGYIVVAYDFLKKPSYTLAPFFRYAHLNNHLKVSESITQNESFRQDIITVGLNYKPTPGVVFKIDYQFYFIGDGSNFQMFNSGIGVWF